MTSSQTRATPVATPREIRGGRRRFRWEHVVIPVVVLGLWQLLSGWLIDPIFISSPVAVGEALYTAFATGEILPHIGTTFAQIGVGFVIGFVPGVVLGNVMGLSKTIGSVVSPYLTFFFTIPLIAIAPLFVIWLGIGFPMKVGLVAFIVFFLVARTTFTGMSTINNDIVNSVHIMGASRWQRIRLAILPQEFVWILTAAKLALPLAVAGDIVGEFISSTQGLGFVMNNAASILDTTRLLMAVVILALFVTLIVGALSLVERRLLGWQRP
jgi:NitT/TauT family transport system permease protein